MEIVTSRETGGEIKASLTQDTLLKFLDGKAKKEKVMMIFLITLDIVFAMIGMDMYLDRKAAE